jgi:Domain of unknown function (DUF4442)
MADRSKFDARLEGIMGDFLAKIPGLTEQLKTFARHPRSVGALIESRNAWLNRKFLGAASNLVEPFLVGMGLSIASLTEDSAEITMPGFIRNQGEAGAIHNAALAALGEFAARIFWEHHLDLQRSELQATSVSTKLMTRAQGPMRAVFRYPVSEREGVLLTLRSETYAEAESLVSIYDALGKLVAEVEIEWRFSRRLALSAGTGSATGTETETETKAETDAATDASKDDEL